MTKALKPNVNFSFKCRKLQCSHTVELVWYTTAMHISLIGSQKVVQIQTGEPIKNNVQNLRAYCTMNEACLTVETASCKLSYA